ncbi:MAG: pathogenicity locus [Bacteroidetes bacterium RIFCSPLOWO2_12_FULL_35_15]|nr:MAG: pathogenicity locus [Bacteroidetes bacterium RIFCSPLOWO2_12_FULL_35_15]
MKTLSKKDKQISELRQIPGVGISIANDLINIGITSITDLKNKDPEWLYHQSNKFAGVVQDRCLLYVFKCAVYYASEIKHDKEKLKWWNWKDRK